MYKIMAKQIVVEFPKSQLIEDKEGFLENVELINSDKGLELYGGGAYLVNEDWYNEVMKGNVPTREYTDEELVNGLEINYTFPIEVED